VELTPHEKSALKLSTTEYAQGEWMTCDPGGNGKAARLSTLLNPNIVMDQALLQIIQEAKNC
jgi:hypothetical protein